MRRGQILSLDALLSLVIVVMVIGVVINANDMIKAEITNLVEWYDRANIASNMLDILTKSSGYPKDWENNPNNVIVVGLRSEEYVFAIDNDKLLALTSSIETNNTQVINSLTKLSGSKDFQLEFYLTTKNMNISGAMPRTELQVSDVDLTTIGAQGNHPFLIQTGSLYYNGMQVTSDVNNEPLNPGDILEFITAEEITIKYQSQNKPELQTLSPGTYVKIKVTDTISNFKFTYTASTNTLHITGQGNLEVSILAISNANVSIQYVCLHPANLTTPTYSYAIINGSVEVDSTIITTSKARSPWIEYYERNLVMAVMIYNKTMKITYNKTKRILAGKLIYNVPMDAYLEITVPQNEAGSSAFVIFDGSILKLLFVEKDTQSSNIIASIWQNNATIPQTYEGNVTTIKIPWGDIFGRFNSENGGKPVELWLYENSFGTVVLRDLGNIGLILEPKFEPILIKVWVWDDR